MAERPAADFHLHFPTPADDPLKEPRPWRCCFTNQGILVYGGEGDHHIPADKPGILWGFVSDVHSTNIVVNDSELTELVRRGYTPSLEDMFPVVEFPHATLTYTTPASHVSICTQ